MEIVNRENVVIKSGEVFFVTERVEKRDGHYPKTVSLCEDCEKGFE